MPRNGRRTESHIETMVDWFDCRGYNVIFERGGDSHIDHSAGRGGEVVVDSSPSLECQLHTLLHEAGHYMVSRRRNYTTKFSHGYPAVHGIVNTGRARTMRHWVHKVQEEVEAWEEGLNLAKLLGISIRTQAWERNKCPALMSYFREAIHGWALKSRSKITLDKALRTATRRAEHRRKKSK